MYNTQAMIETSLDARLFYVTRNGHYRQAYIEELKELLADIRAGRRHLTDRRDNELVAVLYKDGFEVTRWAIGVVLPILKARRHKSLEFIPPSELKIEQYVEEYKLVGRHEGYLIYDFHGISDQALP